VVWEGGERKFTPYPMWARQQRGAVGYVSSAACYGLAVPWLADRLS